MQLSAAEKKFYDAIMAVYEKNGGKITFSDRQSLGKLRADLNIPAERGIVINKQAVDDAMRAARAKARAAEEAQERERAKALREQQERKRREAEAERARREAAERERQERAEREAKERAEAEKHRRREAELKALRLQKEREMAEKSAAAQREMEERARAERKRAERRNAILIGIIPLISPLIWVLGRVDILPVQAGIVGFCAVFAAIMYFCKFSGLGVYMPNRWSYISYGVLMFLSIGLVPAVDQLNNAVNELPVVGGGNLPVAVSIGSVIVMGAQTGWFGRKFFQLASLGVAAVFGVLQLLVTGHFILAGLMALILAGLYFGRQDSSDFEQGGWRWIAMAAIMVFCASLGVADHWFIAGFGICFATGLVVKN